MSCVVVDVSVAGGYQFHFLSYLLLNWDVGGRWAWCLKFSDALCNTNTHLPDCRCVFMCVCGGERMVRMVFACIFECLIDAIWLLLVLWTLNILPPCSSAPLYSYAPVWSKLAASGEWGIRSLWKRRWRKRHNTQHIYSVYRQQWVPA